LKPIGNRWGDKLLDLAGVAAFYILQSDKSIEALLQQIVFSRV
jgi:hypothetical protein